MQNAPTNYKRLRKNLNDFVGEGYAYIPAWAPIDYGERNWSFIHATLADWQAKGFLKVMKSPEHCTPDELCIQVFNFIDAKTPLPPNWLSKERIPPKWPYPYPPGTNINWDRTISD